ncbi:response regulator transcription factor [Gordonia hydrophobica]|uniref:Response regulator transcription factor n=1 Tax=Gordonia hydrophobica TaxID=40516 RepID=A0ABZ2U1F3_9ACTN|nr:response regulator transcription factor [Gordonia hydrophobica]MBM7368491.1 CheY-like chemotaxis protein [Gordonia hydrophobica]
MTSPASSPADNRVTLRVLVYSDNPNTRRQVFGALGEQLHPDLPDLQFIEVATAPTVLSHLDGGAVDLAILDGEAAPTGGIGLAKQIRDEYEPCPPLLVLIARKADRWLADWSRADATATLPIDPLELPRTVVGLLNQPVQRP